MDPPDSRIEQKIVKKIGEIAAVADSLPSVVVIHDLPEFNLRYMSRKGLELLGKEWEEIKGLSNQEYHDRFFNPEESRDYVPRILEMLTRNSDEVVSYFQQVRTSRDRPWDWYMSMTCILERDDDGRPLLSITTAMKIDPQHYFTAKASRLLEENMFLRQNYHQFAKLGTREKEVLALLALGKSSVEIGGQLHISVATAETHRKNIRKKLNAGNNYELALYARAFDLI